MKNFFILVFSFLIIPHQSFAQNFNPTEEQIKTVLEFTREWQDLVDQEEYETAYRQFSESLKNDMSLEQWIDFEEELRNQTGQMISRTIEQLNWYPDVNGIKGALAVGVQSFGTFELGDSYKREVSIVFEGGNTLRIERVETNFSSYQVVEAFKAKQTATFGRRFKTADITREEWETYLFEILALAKWRSYKRDDQIVIDKAEPGAIYVFTTPDHFAHPAVVKREVVEKDGQVSIGMIGYYAGEESSFARWWQQFNELNEKIKDNLKTK